MVAVLVMVIVAVDVSRGRAVIIIAGAVRVRRCFRDATAGGWCSGCFGGGGGGFGGAVFRVVIAGAVIIIITIVRVGAHVFVEVVRAHEPLLAFLHLTGKPFFTCNTNR